MNFLIPVLVLLVLSPSRSSAESIVIANGEWAPYQSEYLERDGVVSDIVKQAFALQDVSVEYKFFPWKRNFDLAKHGVVDGSIMWARRGSREEYFVYSDVIIDAYAVFFHLKSASFSWDNSPDFEKIRLGVMLGWKLGGPDRFASVEYVVKEEQNISKLLRGRIGLFLTDQRVGYYTLRKHFRADEVALITHSHRTKVSEPYYLILNRKLHEDSDMLERFNAGLKMLKDSGVYGRLMIELDN